LDQPGKFLCYKKQYLFIYQTTSVSFMCSREVVQVAVTGHCTVERLSETEYSIVSRPTYGGLILASNW